MFYTTLQWFVLEVQNIKFILKIFIFNIQSQLELFVSHTVAASYYLTI